MAKAKKQRRQGQVKARGWVFVLLTYDDHSQVLLTCVHMSLKGAQYDAQENANNMMVGLEKGEKPEMLQWVKAGSTEWQAVFGGGQGTFVIHKTKIYE